MAIIDDKNNPTRTVGVCPICLKPREGIGQKSPYHPFCSKRCADVDLGRWFSGDYAIPAVEPPDDWSEEL